MELIEERQQIVAIPLEQGRFFNDFAENTPRPVFVAIPLEQGRFFNLYRGC
ncbi:hypothetical protein HMPREF0198_1320 [Cardiobacterium hominis ATCC 15826]|uniref:Uncharacterized protein n=1 Tax=Cardiobacterium hominis (strain ATCC 15826 / DSM 8339 / NCTC 10426 / 6573) TaxID=638300 RepID=C8N9Z2_CARH6|nr:hypothetical protein HMPREF0198_1320 [Cardiobacterium hominis ATCC 15826]